MSENQHDTAAVLAELVSLTLVPVEVFGGDCDCHERSGPGQRPDCLGWSYGLSDAVAAWSDCNRAAGHIYRVDDIRGSRSCGPDETVTVRVAAGQLPFFQKCWGDGASDANRTSDLARVRRVVAAAKALVEHWRSRIITGVDMEQEDLICALAREVDGGDDV